jgi:toxin ParE1/3/4
MPTLTWAPRARQDLIGIWHHYAARNPDAADRLLDEVERVAGLLADNPMMGVGRSELGPGVRTFVAARIFVVAYRVLEDGVDVLAVVHHARDVRRVLRDL